MRTTEEFQWFIYSSILFCFKFSLLSSKIWTIDVRSLQVPGERWVVSLTCNNPRGLLWLPCEHHANKLKFLFPNCGYMCYAYVPHWPSRRFRLPPYKYFLQTVLGLCYSFLSWFTYVSRRWQSVLDVLNFAVVQSLKRPASDRDWRFSHVTLAFVWRFHRYSGGTLPVSILSLLLGRGKAPVT